MRYVKTLLIPFKLKNHAHITCKWKSGMFDGDELLKNNKNS